MSIHPSIHPSIDQGLRTVGRGGSPTSPVTCSDGSSSAVRLQQLCDQFVRLLLVQRELPEASRARHDHPIDTLHVRWSTASCDDQGDVARPARARGGQLTRHPDRLSERGAAFASRDRHVTSLRSLELVF